MHTNNKRQKITEAMSLLDEEKEALSSNTYLRVAEGLNDSYNKADGGLYVLNWVAHIPMTKMEIMSSLCDHTARR